MDEMGKKFDKTAKNNAVTYIMVIVAWLVMMALQQAGMLNSSTTGLLVPVCIYSIMAVSLNLTVGILGDLSLGQAGFMCVGASVQSIKGVCADFKSEFMRNRRKMHRCIC